MQVHQVNSSCGGWRPLEVSSDIIVASPLPFTSCSRYQDSCTVVVHEAAVMRQKAGRHSSRLVHLDAPTVLTCSQTDCIQRNGTQWQGRRRRYITNHLWR
jgi:hypothetical protein